MGLPISIREWLDLKRLRLLQPRPARRQRQRKAATDGPLVVVGMFGTASGIGQSAHLCADGLEARGHKVVRVDVSDHLAQSDVIDPRTVTQLPDDAAGTMIVHLNPPEMVVALHLLRFWRPRRWRVIGYWVYELQRPPPDWKAAARLVSEVWTPSAFSAAALATIYKGPIKVVPHAVTAPPQIAVATSGEDQGDVTTILVAADGRSSFERKGVRLAIEAFRQAFADNPNVHLFLKTRNLRESGFSEEIEQQVADLQNMTLVDENLSADARWALLDRADILLSPHSSEGFGLVLAEAMALGKCVVATGWSGNLEFMTATNSVLLPYTLVPVQDAAQIYAGADGLVWAEPSVDDIVAALTDLVSDPARITDLGARARQDVQETLGAEVYERALSGV